MSGLTCPECGARLAEGAERCDLCGTPVVSGTSSPDESVEHDIPEPETTADDLPAGVHCNACGWRNPAGAKFCSRCGAPLQDMAVRPEETARVRRVQRRPEAGGDVESPQQGDAAAESDPAPGSLTRHVAVLVGLAILLVVALYMITIVSKQRAPTRAEAAVEAPPGVRGAAVIEEFEAVPIAENHSAVVDSLRAEADQADAEEARQFRQRLVDFFLEIGRIDRAAIEQKRLAESSGRGADWRRAGNLLYDWMETVRQERKTDVALLAIDAYKRVLEENPDDLDVRAALGWVYQYDRQNPMEAIRQTNLVLEEDPEHLAANYNRGVFLLRINRVSEAIDQFERVQEIAGADSPYARQAQAWITSIRRQREANE